MTNTTPRTESSSCTKCTMNYRTYLLKKLYCINCICLTLKIEKLSVLERSFLTSICFQFRNKTSWKELKKENVLLNFDWLRFWWSLWCCLKSVYKFFSDTKFRIAVKAAQYLFHFARILLPIASFTVISKEVEQHRGAARVSDQCWAYSC